MQDRRRRPKRLNDATGLGAGLQAVFQGLRQPRAGSAGRQARRLDWDISNAVGMAKEETAMIDEKDVYRSAKLMIDRHGEEAPLFAAMRADKMLEGGDMAGRAVWLRIMRAVQSMIEMPPTSATRN